jgi:hypothetical protein
VRNDLGGGVLPSETDMSMMEKSAVEQTLKTTHTGARCNYDMLKILETNKDDLAGALTHLVNTLI